MKFIKDNTLYTIDEIRALYPNVTFPVGFDVKELGFEIVHTTNPPEASATEYAVEDGVVKQGDRWVVKWKLVPYDADTLTAMAVKAEEDRVAGIKAQIKTIEDKITSRMLREALLDSAVVHPVTGLTSKQQIAAWETEIQALRDTI